MKYRYLLPVAQLAIYAVLTVLGCPYMQQVLDRVLRPTGATPDLVGNGDFVPVCISFTPSTMDQVAFGLSFPAVAASVALTEPLISPSADWDCATYDYVSHLRASLFIPLFWYLIGRSIDRRYLYTPRPEPWKWAFAGLALVGLVAFATIWASVTIPDASYEFLPIQAGVHVWLGIGILFLVRRMYLWRRAAIDASV